MTPINLRPKLWPGPSSPPEAGQQQTGPAERAATVSVIVPARNSAATLPACLRALQSQSYPPAEIIVVDDGSTDGTAGIAHQFGVTVLTQAHSGPAAARNRGAQQARGELLLFTDADCAPAPDWIEQLIEPFKDPTIHVTKGTYRTRQPELAARFVQQEYQDRYDRMAGRPEIDFVDTYSAAYRRQVFAKTGGFDERFRVGQHEDIEFSFRLAGLGYRMVFVPQAVVYHRHKDSLAGYARRKYLVGFTKAFVTVRYPGKLISDSHTPPVLKLQMGLAGLGSLLLLGGALLRRRDLLAGGGVAWLGLIASGLPFYYKIGRRDPAVLAVAPLLLSLRAWVLGVGFLVGNLALLRQRRA
jgi:glycosyltransferase involved in cell wall biosynthesis